ncbi:MAG TPA: hypothetical protein VFV86_12630, partial [Nitrososphaeraceae archaeon]|nr:hypothetical protein [Nitrososphaeraceae archaeon]
KLTSSINTTFTQSLFKINNNFFRISLNKNSGSENATLNVFFKDTNSYGINSFPYYNNEWWSVLVNFSSNNNEVTTYTKTREENQIILGEDIFISSSATTSSINSATLGTTGSGIFQELRYWSEPLSESIFEYHVLNPDLFSGNNLSSSYNNLVYRLPLGNDLLTNTSRSYHPNTHISFSVGDQTFTLTSGSYVSNYENRYVNYQNSSFTRISDKVNILSNNITESVLSPFIGLGGQNDQDRLYISPNTPHVEIALSPTQEIDNYILNSLKSFDIDNYLGDPSEMYSSSYFNLELLKKDFTSKFLTGSYNYQDFINLVKNFDNSLFKILQNYVPARSNLISGVSITSPIYERNKYKYIPPSVTSQSIDDAEFEIANISEDKSYLYDFLTGNKESFYTGDITGSKVNIYDYFLETNPNIYLVSRSGLDNNFFNHSDFNITLNNISSSRFSIIRKKFDSKTGSLEIFTTAELQDYYDDLTTHQNSRYEGSKTISNFYNTYSIGDRSYGKTAAIDRYVRKTGLFVEIVSSSFLTRRDNIVLKYLVDEEGGLTELNEKNKNWVEVQNTFKAGDNLVVSLFDNQKYGDQKFLNGEKPIFNSGYNYKPVFYFRTGSVCGSTSDCSSSFDISGDSGQVDFRVLPPSQTITTSSITSIFDIGDPLRTGEYNDGQNYHNTSGSILSYYQIPIKHQYTFRGQFVISAVFPDVNTSCSITFMMSGSQGSTLLATQSFNSTLTSTGSGNYVITRQAPVDVLFPTPPYYAPAPIGPALLLSSSFLFLDPPIVERDYDGTILNTLNFPLTISLYEQHYRYYNSSEHFDPQVATAQMYRYSGSFVNYSTFITSSGAVSSGSYQNVFVFNLTSPVITYSKDSIVTFKLINNNNGGTYDLLSGGELKSNIDTNPPFTDNPFVTSITNDPGTITFSEELSGFFLSGEYTFLGNRSLLYYKYGDVELPFTLETQDIIRIIKTEGVQEGEFIITNIRIIGNNVVFYTASPIPVSLIDGFTEMLFLKRIKDETNVIIRFKMKNIKTSYGLIIPENLHPDVLKKIDIITKEVQQKIPEQSIIDQISGGEF